MGRSLPEAAGGEQVTPLYWAAYALINTALALFGLHILARGVGRLRSALIERFS
jgi:hypothetical protein